jgi:D-serine deaminase-like pyridoxal phosphate-dependent protein
MVDDPPRLGQGRIAEDRRNRVRAAYGSAVGRHRDDLITPALVLDRPAAERNIGRMAERLASLPAGIRPHMKAHKSPDLAERQMAAGAIGMSVATVWEAAVLVDCGVPDVFVVNEIADPAKLRIVAGLARQATIRVAVDDPGTARLLSDAAVAAGVTISALVEVDTGMGRAGVASRGKALDLARDVVAGAGLRFDGLTGYEGHCSLIADAGDRRAQQRAAMHLLMEVADAIVGAGLPCPILSAGGTATWEWTASEPRITEIQAGTYVLMDTEYAHMAEGFEHALFVQATVISRSGGRIVVDAGSKSVGDGILARIVGSDAQPSRFDEEHGIFGAASNGGPMVGDRVRLIPGYAPSTVNLYDAYHVVDGDHVADIWPVMPRGPGHDGLASLWQQAPGPGRQS